MPGSEAAGAVGPVGATGVPSPIGAPVIGGIIRGCVARGVTGMPWPPGTPNGGSGVGAEERGGAPVGGIGGMKPGRTGAETGGAAGGVAIVGRSPGAPVGAALGVMGRAGADSGAAGEAGVAADGPPKGVGVGATERGGVKGPGAPGRGGGGVAPAGMGGGSGGIVGRGIAVTGGGFGASKAGVGTAGCSADTTPTERGVCVDGRGAELGIVPGSGTGAIGRTAVGGIEVRESCGTTGGPAGDEGSIVITPPHTEHRARTPPVGTFDGSTR